MEVKQLSLPFKKKIPKTTIIFYYVQICLSTLLNRFDSKLSYCGLFCKEIQYAYRPGSHFKSSHKVNKNHCSKIVPNPKLTPTFQEFVNIKVLQKFVSRKVRKHCTLYRKLFDKIHLFYCR